MFLREDKITDRQMADAYEVLLRNRILLLRGEITAEGAPGCCDIDNLVDNMMVLDLISGEPIKLFIDTPGGDVIPGMQLYDTMQLVRSPVYTVCLGQCASMGAILLAGGEEGHRYVMPHGSVMLHLASTVMGGTPEETARQQKQFEELQTSLTDIIMDRCHKDPMEREKIVASWRDCVWLNAKESLEYGIVDGIMSPEYYKSLFYENIVKP